MTITELKNRFHNICRTTGRHSGAYSHRTWDERHAALSPQDNLKQLVTEIRQYAKESEYGKPGSGHDDVAKMVIAAGEDLARELGME